MCWKNTGHCPPRVGWGGLVYFGEDDSCYVCVCACVCVGELLKCLVNETLELVYLHVHVCSHACVFDCVYTVSVLTCVCVCVCVSVIKYEYVCVCENACL